MNPLDILLLVPLAGFLLTLLLPKSGTGPIRVFALIVSVVAFLLALGIAIGYKSGAPGQQFVTDLVWIQNPNIHYHVGLDGLSLWLVVLTTFLTPIAVLLSWQSVRKEIKPFFALLMLLEFALIGVFSSLDLVIYYGFWELTLIPMYLFIGVWGSGSRSAATMKFFIYTFAGSVLMLAGIIFLAGRAGTTNYSAVLDALNSGKLAPLRERRTAALPRLLYRVRHQAGSVPAAYLAARFVRLRARRRHHDAGRGHGQDGHLQHHAFLLAAVSFRGSPLR